MDRALIAVALVVVALAAARLLERRREEVPTIIRRGEVPTQVVLSDVGLAGPGVVVFTEASCRSCRSVLEELMATIDTCPVVEVEHGAMKAVHERHGIDTVPTIVVAAADGSVVVGWTGRTDPVEVAAAAAQLGGV
ncbi:MAG: hypothetical protein ACI8Y4_003579 [Candidatus Poriferisodalaceae bacterium]|jgi:hypothetical protein